MDDLTEHERDLVDAWLAELPEAAEIALLPEDRMRLVLAALAGGARQTGMTSTSS